MECTRLCRNLFIFKVGNRFYIRKAALFGNDNEVRCVIVIRKVDFFFSVRRRAHTCDNHIELARLNAWDKAVPLKSLYFKFLSECVRNLLSDLNVIAVCKLAFLALSADGHCTECLFV